MDLSSSDDPPHPLHSFDATALHAVSRLRNILSLSASIVAESKRLLSALDAGKLSCFLALAIATTLLLALEGLCFRGYLRNRAYIASLSSPRDIPLDWSRNDTINHCVVLSGRVTRRYAICISREHYSAGDYDDSMPQIRCLISELLLHMCFAYAYMAITEHTLGHRHDLSRIGEAVWGSDLVNNSFHPEQEDLEAALENECTVCWSPTCFEPHANGKHSPETSFQPAASRIIVYQVSILSPECDIAERQVAAELQTSRYGLGESLTSFG